MFSKLTQFTNDMKPSTKMACLGGVLCIGLVAGYKYLYNGKTRDTPKAAVEEQRSFQEVYRQVIMNVQQCISRHQALNGQVIKCILRNQYKLAQSDFKSFIFKVRNQRRRVLRDKHEYRRVIHSLDTQNQQLMDKNLNAILAHFNIQKTNWIQTVQLWSSDTQQNKQQWENLLIDLDNQLLDSLRDKTKQPLSYRKLQDIFKFKIHTINHLNQSGLDLQSSLNSDDQPDQNAKYTLIDKYIQDLVFNKYGVEEEDILYSEKQLSRQDQDKIYTIEDEFTQLIRVAIYGDDQSQQENEQEVQNQQDSEDNQQNQQIQDQAQVDDQVQAQVNSQRSAPNAEAQQQAK